MPNIGVMRLCLTISRGEVWKQEVNMAKIMSGKCLPLVIYCGLGHCELHCTDSNTRSVISTCHLCVLVSKIGIHAVMISHNNSMHAFASASNQTLELPLNMVIVDVTNLFHISHHITQNCLTLVTAWKMF